MLASFRNNAYLCTVQNHIAAKKSLLHKAAIFMPEDFIGKDNGSNRVGRWKHPRSPSYMRLEQRVVLLFIIVQYHIVW